MDRVLLVLVLFFFICNGSHMGGGLLRLALSASLLTSSLCRKGVDGGGGFFRIIRFALTAYAYGGEGGGILQKGIYFEILKSPPRRTFF